MSLCFITSHLSHFHELPKTHEDIEQVFKQMNSLAISLWLVKSLFVSYHLFYLCSLDLKRANESRGQFSGSGLKGYVIQGHTPQGQGHNEEQGYDDGQSASCNAQRSTEGLHGSGSRPVGNVKMVLN